ncbi:MAG: alpha/beta hydrolase [Campylobacterales bacterium]|nr:alpha/beta hydrolase [Campylobacterales bacterium]
MAIKKIDLFGKNFTINYEIVNSDKEKVIVFLHGWGSNKEVMRQAFSAHLSGFIHIYVDMPGFGKSDNNYVLTTIDYANIMKIFLEKIGINPNQAVIVGHSFGGKVATTLMPKLLVLLSSAGIVEKKPLSVQLKIKLAKFFNILGLGNLTKVFRSKDVYNMSHQMYETFKNVVNEDFSEYFKGFYNPCLIFWGSEDRATSIESGQLIHSYIKKSQMRIFQGDHYFFLKNSKEISDIIDKNS